MTYLIGIDDAGRGPVIGPMILAGILIKKEDEHKLKEMGAKDSKLLLPTKRKALSLEIKKNYPYHAEITYPSEIDASDNLNNLEAIKAAMIINKLADKIKEDIEVIIDCPSVNIKAWNSFVEKLVINKKIKVVSEHKADFNHPSVSAASIIAKEIREDEVSKIKKELQIDFGSGYPADPRTIDFITKNFDNEKFSGIIRHSWGTVKKLKNNQKKLF